MGTTNVPGYLAGRGVAFETLPHPRAVTSVQEAISLGIPVGDVVKTIVLDTKKGHALAVVPATRRLDLARVRAVLGDSTVRLADETEIERDLPAFELGAIPPIGALTEVPVYVDREVFDHEEIVFADGRQTSSVRVRTEDLFRDEWVVVADLCTHPEIEDDWIE